MPKKKTCDGEDTTSGSYVSQWTLPTLVAIAMTSRCGSAGARGGGRGSLQWVGVELCQGAKFRVGDSV